MTLVVVDMGSTLEARRSLRLTLLRSMAELQPVELSALWKLLEVDVGSSFARLEVDAQLRLLSPLSTDDLLCGWLNLMKQFSIDELTLI